ncbi:hypothetical protein A9Q73_11035 [Bermanella sp. 47_1433_sub80_T6]|nr:hypothetical protein A9Q73_11035 [Bermanella sp. 47_1433_sub80_T6]
MSLLDQAGNVRAGEELDIQVIETYFKQLLPNLKGGVEISQFPGGASNLTYQVTIDSQEFILRRPPFGKIAKSAHDMLREARTRIQLIFPRFDGHL